MLPYQLPPEEDRGMSRREKIEWVVVILAILVWWPKIFLGESSWSHHPAYNVLCYVGVPLALLLIFIRRVVLFRRFVAEEERKRDEAEEREKKRKA